MSTLSGNTKIGKLSAMEKSIFINYRKQEHLHLGIPSLNKVVIFTVLLIIQCMTKVDCNILLTHFWPMRFQGIFRGYKMGTLARNGFASRCSKRIHANFWDFETYEKMLRRFIFVITGFGANWSSDRRDSIFFLPKKNVLKVINKNSFLMFN